MPDDVQAPEAQGGEAPGIFDPYLDAVPEDARETVAGYLKDAEKHVNDRIQKASELEKTLGPYQQVEALANYKPEDLQELLVWHQQVTSSDEAYQEWLAAQAQAAGFTKAEAEQLETAEEDGELSREQIQKLIEERAAEQLGPLQQQVSELAEARLVDSIEQDIRDEWKRLEAESGMEFSDDQKAMILDLGLNYEGDQSWVQVGFDRFKEITAAGAAAFVQEKAAQPKTPISTGGQEAFKPTTDFGEANRQMRERLRSMQS